MSTHLKKANLILILILLIGLGLPGNADAASENSAAYSSSFGKSSPANNASVNTSGVTLQWGSISNIFQYRYCYYSYELTSNVCDIADKSTWISSGTSRSVQLPTLTLGKTYYWQVGAKLTDNSFVYADGDISATWKFTTSSTVGAGIYDNTHSNWAFNGKWAALTATGPYGDTYKESRDIPDYATFAFTGSRFQLFY